MSKMSAGHGDPLNCTSSLDGYRNLRKIATLRLTRELKSSRLLEGLNLHVKIANADSTCTLYHHRPELLLSSCALIDELP